MSGLELLMVAWAAANVLVLAFGMSVARRRTLYDGARRVPQQSGDGGSARDHCGGGTPPGEPARSGRTGQLRY